MRSFPKSLLFILLVIIFSYWAIKPLFVPGFFPLHDDTTPSRVYEMAKALSYGQFPVRWVPDLGYGFGYPLFNFYAPLPYYIGGVFNLLGLDAIVSAKIMFGIGILLSGICMYFFIREVIGDIAAVTTGIIYLYSPYHAVNIYVRGAVGEYYAYGFLPLFLLGIYKLVAKKEVKRGILIGSLGLSGILLSHNILGLITGYFLITGLFGYFLCILVKKRSLQIFYLLVIMFLLGFGLSSFFTLPALFEKQYTKVEELTQKGSDFHDHFVYADQLWDYPWGYAGSAKGREDGMSFKIGKIHVLLGITGFAVFFFFSRINNLSALGYLQIVLLVISLFFMLEPSRIFWENLPGFAYIQYPWRFLNFVALSLSVLSSFILLPLKKNLQFVVGAGIILIILLFNIKYFVPREYLSLTDEDYTSSLNLRYKISKISDEYLPPDFITLQTSHEIAQESLSPSSNVLFKQITDTPTFKKYDLKVTNPTAFLTNITFFPGWQVFINEKRINTLNQEGRFELQLPEGQYQLTFIFKNTLIRTIANAISVFSVFLLVYVSLFWKGIIYDKKELS